MTRSEKKRAAIMEAGTRIFLEKGFDNASMDEIAAAAEVSKRTVYSHFGSKEELFSRVMYETCEAKCAFLCSIMDLDIPVGEALTLLGRGFLDMLFDPQSIMMIRAMTVNAGHDQTAAQGFIEQGPKNSSRMLADYLEEQTRRGKLKVGKPDLAAQSFMSSLFGYRQIESLVVEGAAPTPEEREAMVNNAVEIFLYGVVGR
ncbi:TetR/AcrR family transcriptional regulator [Kiloniella sp. b19]|uniref:TetR/AcrR family transcriptional regulator n=1 Tax=Kiloniella sp. GXU_MW_B19 TaxID=3141326 RepID=UPI0031DCE2B2